MAYGGVVARSRRLPLLLLAAAGAAAFCTRCMEDFSGLMTRRGAGGGAQAFITAPTGRNEPSQGYRIDFRAAAIVNGNPSWGWNPAGELQLQVAGGLAGVVAPTGAGTFATRPPLGAPAVGGAPPPASLCTGLVDGTVYVAERWGAVAAFTELAVDVGLSDGSPVVGLAFAYRNVDNYYAVVSSPVTGCTAVVKVAGGVPTVLASTSAPGAAVANASAPGGAATRTRLHVAQAGPAITVWLNGRRDAPVLTASDSAGAPLPPGNVGIFAAAANRAVFDNWLLVVAPTCSDGIHNGLEEGPDCGVAACGNACPSETATETVWSAAGGGSLVGWFRETWGTASGAPSWGIVDDASADAGALTQRQNTGLAFQGAPGGNSDNWMGGAFLLCGKCGRSVDQEIEMEVTPIDNDWLGLVTRMTDRDNFYQVNTRQENPQTAIHRRRAGVNTVLLALNTRTYTVGATFTLRLRTVGGRITIWWDGALWQDITDPSPLLVPGWAGLFVTNQDNSLWRRARVVNYRPVNALCASSFAVLSPAGQGALAVSLEGERLRSASPAGVQTTFWPSATGAGDLWHSPYYTSFSSVPLAVTTPRGKALDFRATAGFPVFLWGYPGAAADVAAGGLTLFLVVAAPAPSGEGVLLHKGGLRGLPGWVVALAPGPGATSVVRFTVAGSGSDASAAIATPFTPDEVAVVGLRVAPAPGGGGTAMTVSGSLNGAPFAAPADPTVNVTGPPTGFSNYLYLGAGEDMSLATRARALVHEVALFSGALSDADFAAAAGWLVTKYAAGAACPDIVPAAPGVLLGGAPGSRCTGARRGDVCSLQCAPGYRLTAGALTVTCGGGQWSAPPAYCEAACPTLAVPNTARTDCARGVFGDAFDSNATLVRWVATPAQPNPWAVDATGALAATGVRLCGEDAASPQRLVVQAPSWGTALFSRVRVSARVRFDRAFTLLPRYVDASNFYAWTADADSGSLAFTATVGGATSTLCNTTAYAVPPGVWRDVRAELGADGSVLVTWGGQVVCRASTAALPYGTAGVGKPAVSTVAVDAFAVDVLEPCPGGCTNLTAGASCTLACDPGLFAIAGNTTRTCVAYPNGTTAFSGTPLVCGYFAPIAPPVSATLPEDAPAGRAVATVNATLPPGTPGAILLEITGGNTGGAFSIEPCSGVVRVANPAAIDFERVAPGSANAFALTVRAYVAGVSPAPETTTTVSVAVTDAPDAPRLVTASCTVPENAGVGAPVCTLLATDDDAVPSPIAFTLVAAFGSPDAATVFALSTAGALTVRTAVLDYEAVRSYSLTVRVADAGNPSLATSGVVVVTVTNVQEPPSITSPLAYDVDQTRVVAGGPVSAGPMTASDPDGDAVTFSVGANPLVGLLPATNQLVFTATRSYAAVPPFERDGRLVVDVLEVTLTATDSGAPPLAAVATVRVYILANVTAAGVPVVRGMEVRPAVPAAGSGSAGGAHSINTDGSDTIYFAASGIPARAGDVVTLNASTTAGGARWWTSACSYLALPTPACGACNGVIACATGAGWGPGWTGALSVVAGGAPGPATPVPASILLAWAYAPPVVTSVAVEHVDGQPDPELTTAGGTPVIITGFGFGGPSAPIAAAYGPCNDTAVAGGGGGGGGAPVGCDFTYSFTRTGSTQTSIRVLTAPGVGAALRLQLTVGSLTVTPPNVALSYAAPVITGVYRAGNGSIFAFGGAGGAQIFVVGRNFGAPTTPAALMPRLSYGPAWTYAPGADMPIAATSCVYPTPASSHSLIRCLSGPGLGANLSLVVSVGGQLSALSPPNVTISYLPPRITGVSGVGSRDLDTKGGQAVTLTLVHSGPAAFSGPGGFYPPPVVTYGSGNLTGRRREDDNFTAAGCETTGADPAAPAPVTCLTGEGAGGVGGLFWRIVMGGQESLPFRAPPTCKYAPPSIAGFAGPGAVDADTQGGQAITLTGKNFGPANITFGAGLDVFYETAAAFNGSATARLVFRPAACSKPAPSAAKAEHDTLQCVMGPGAGAPLAWTVVVAEQKSTVPTTNYVAPVVSNVTANGVTPVTSASTEGGATVQIRGRGFGPAASPALGGRPLVQWVEYGTPEDPYRPRSFTVVSDTLITAVLAPGMGRDLSFRISVADQLSVSVPCCGANGSVSYATPTVAGVAPASAPSVGGVVARVSVRNAAMLDATTEHALLLNGREVPIVDRYPSRAAVEAGNLTAAMLLPANHFLAFEVPPGVGRAYVTVAAFRRAVPSLRVGSPATALAEVTYATPAIITAAVGPIDATTFPLLNASFGAGFDASDARVLTLATTNAGPSAALARLEVQLVDSLGRPDPADPSWNPARCVPLVGQWSHDRVVALCSVPRGNVRISVPTVGPTGAPGAPVLSNAAPFTDLAPIVVYLNASAPGGRTANFSTAGGDVVAVGVANLASAQGVVNVTVGGAPAPIVTDASGATAVDPAQVVATVVNPQVAAAGNGVDASRVVVRLLVRLPPGQGSQAPLVVFRDGTPGSGAAGAVRYAPPALAAVAVTEGNVTTVAFPYAPNATAGGGGGALGVRVSTEGAVVVVRGANLGVCPVVGFGPARGAACARDLLPDDKLAVSLTPDGLTVAVPPGEGDGSAYGGWRFTLAAGDQSVALPAGYRAPAVARAYGEGGRLPTTGGVRLVVEGANFGGLTAPDPVVVVVLGGGVSVPCAGATRDPAAPHRKLVCTLPAGSGANLTLGVSVAEVTGFTPGVLTYDSPEVARVATWVPPSGNLSDTPANLTAGGGLPAALGDFLGPAGGPPAGGYLARVSGSGFGAWAPGAQCVFLAMSRAADLRCDGAAHTFEEGEVEAARVLLWTHTDVVFVVPPSAGGVRHVVVVARGQRSAGVPLVNGTAPPGAPAQLRSSEVWVFDPPVLTGVSPRSFGTDGRELITLTGRNLGFGPTGPANLARAAAPAYFLPAPLPLPTGAGLPSGVSLRVNFFSAARCVSSAVVDEDGTRPAAVAACRSELDTEGRPVDAGEPGGVPPGYGVVEHDDNHVTFVSISGVGRARNLSVTVTNADGVALDSAPLVVSYAPPAVFRVLPSALQMREFRDAPDGGVAQSILVSGRNFGSADTAGWTDEERAVEVSVDGAPCSDAAGGPASRVVTPSGAVGLSCLLGAAAERGRNNSLAPTVGMKSVVVRVAGQLSEPSSPALFQVTCAAGHFARIGEACLACPRGASCAGYDATKRGVLDSNRTTPDGRPYTECVSCYALPVALPGFHNLAGPEAAACPPAFGVPGRDVCVAPCDPPEACAGGNVCAPGYSNKAPAFRCSTCAAGFYRRAGVCVACPAGAQAIMVVYAALIIVAAGAAYALQKFNVNIAVASIGVDFFQVMAIFANTRVKWPAAIAELFHVLSAFNLNVEIVAPECFLGDVSFVTKFTGIVLLPVAVLGLFGVIHLALVAFKAGIKGRRGNLTRHTGTLTSSVLMFSYLLYIYETKTLLEVFNCAPTTPPDGKEYLAVVFEECGKPGGVQRTLLPWSVVGLLGYTVGYPAAIAWALYANRERVMEDQLLRAKGAGDDRLTNPHAYELRKRLSRVYYQFRPDFYFWSLVIVMRKFFIAFVSVMFNKSASFQMAACLLVLICSYGLHLRALPYMGPGTYDDVLRAHGSSIFTSAVHARIHASIASIESRGRKRVHKNLLDYQGKVDRAAVLGVLTSWLFDYNFVEATLLFGACIVCIMGTMFESEQLRSEYYTAARESTATVVLVVIALCIAYWFTVFVVESFLLATERQRERLLLQNKRSSRKLVDGSGSGGRSPRRGGGAGREFNMGKVDIAVNPLMTGASARGVALAAGGEGVDHADPTAALEALAGFQSQPPPLEMWRMFVASFQAQAAATGSIRAELLAARAALAATSDGGEDPLTPAGARPRTSFTPVAAAGAGAGAGAESLKGYARPTSARR